MACSRWQNETVAWPHRDATPVGEDEIDRAASAIEQLRIAMLVLAVPIARRIRPSVDIASFAPQRRFDRVRIGRGRPVVPTMLDRHR